MSVTLDHVSRTVDGVPHIRDVSLTLERGTLSVLLGPTLSGKTSIMRLLAGLDKPTTGRVLVDGKGIGDISDIVLRDRRHLSQDGLLLAVLALDQHTGELIAGPDFSARGVVAEGDQARLFDEARDVVMATLGDLAPESRTDTLEVKEEVRKALRRYISKTLDRRPVVVPFVLEM